MAQNVTFNGTSYIVPEQGESSWGTNVTAYLVAIASHALQKTGGSFTLTADVDFGATYGLKAVKFSSRSTPATAGVVRLGNNESVAWRNQANGADLALKVNASNVLEFNGNPIFTLALGAANTVLKMNSGGTAYEFGKIGDDNIATTLSWSKISKTGSNLTDIDARSHTSLTDIGTNSHANIDSHIANTSNPHSVTATQVGLGNVDNTSDATKNAASVSLTNKTLVEPVIDNFADFNEESAPSSPSAGKLRVYAKADKKLYKKDSDGLESEVGSGGAGGGRNYLSDWADATKDIGTVTNSLTDVVDTSDRTANKTTWGSSDTSLLTIARSSSSPLRQAYSYLLTEAGSSAGAFVESPLFSLDAVDLGKPVTVSFDVSGNSTADYYQAYICRYDTNDVLKERILIAGTASATSPYSAQLPTGTVNFQGFFIPSSTSTDQYALRIVSNNNSADSIKIDSLYVGPQSVVQGFAGTDWITPTIAPTLKYGATNATNISETNCKYRRIGDTMDVMIQFIFNGAANANGNLVISLPDSLTVDSSKVIKSGGYNYAADAILSSAGKFWTGRAYVLESNNTISIQGADGGLGSSAGALTTNWAGNTTAASNVPTGAALANNNYVLVRMSNIPIVGWSSNVTMANRAVEEYASNSSVTNTDDTTSFAYGMAGSAVISSNPAGAIKKRIRFTQARQPGDILLVEVAPTGSDWVVLNGIIGSSALLAPFKYTEANTTVTGIGAPEWVNATDVDVRIGTNGYYNNGSVRENWSALNSAGFKWRVRKVSGGASAGFPVSARNVVADNTGTTVPSGFIGESTKYTYTTAATTTISTGSSFTVQPGNYMVDLVVGISTAASVTGCYGGYSTDSGATTFSDYSVVGATPNVVAMVCSATLDAVSSLQMPVNITTPTTYYPKLKTYGAGATMRVTITFTRIA